MKTKNEKVVLMTNNRNLNANQTMYGAIGNHMSDEIQNCRPIEIQNYDPDGIAATFGAYVGGSSAGAVAFGFKALFASLNPAITVPVAIGIGLVNGVSTFFVCRKAYKVCNKSAEIADLDPRQNKKPHTIIMLK